jgi:starch synthase
MFIVMITPECAPVAKVGGLADVVQGLSRELSLRGNAVEIILPKYDRMRYDHIWGLQLVFKDLWVPFYDHVHHCDVYFGFVDGLKCFFIDSHSYKFFFNRGTFYGCDDDPERFAFFCRAALEFMWKTHKHPEIIHCHDWQTGLVPVLLFEMYKPLGMSHPRVCYTLHNLRHQGWTNEHVLRGVGLDPPRLMSPDRLQDNGNPFCANLMKGGIVFSNFVTTVSPRYAEEVKNTDLGWGLQQTLHRHADKFGGVLNGLDYDVWNPETDPHIPQSFSLESLQQKYVNKEALRHRLMLRQVFRPIVAVVGRLDQQKGVGLIRHALFYSLAHGCQFVLLGSSPDPEISRDFHELRRYLNDNPDCHVELGYDEELAHLIYAGSDMLVIPSAFEPCGLTQMIAMKYGTVPVVRSTGGLADTVFDADYAHKPYHERNGYVFNDFDHGGMESALSRAIHLWYDRPHDFRELMANGMRYDYSWQHPAQNYLNIYNHIQE